MRRGVEAEQEQRKIEQSMSLARSGVAGTSAAVVECLAGLVVTVVYVAIAGVVVRVPDSITSSDGEYRNLTGPVSEVGWLVDLSSLVTVWPLVLGAAFVGLAWLSTQPVRSVRPFSAAPFLGLLIHLGWAGVMVMAGSSFGQSGSNAWAWLVPLLAFFAFDLYQLNAENNRGRRPTFVAGVLAGVAPLTVVTFVVGL